MSTHQFPTKVVMTRKNKLTLPKTPQTNLLICQPNLIRFVRATAQRRLMSPSKGTNDEKSPEKGEELGTSGLDG